MILQWRKDRAANVELCTTVDMVVHLLVHVVAAVGLKLEKDGRMNTPCSRRGWVWFCTGVKTLELTKARLF